MKEDQRACVSRSGPLRVTFVHAPDPYYSTTQDFGSQFPPVWAYTLAAHAADMPDVDLRLHDTRFENLESMEASDVFVFSGINQDYDFLKKISGDLRAEFPEARYIVGGPICWSFDKAGDLARLTFFDHIFIGDGEETFLDFLYKLREGEKVSKVTVASRRFPIGLARGFYRPFVEDTISRYYGGVLEVSRGCPFLCEFCDIRVLPDNNRAHNKDPKLIVEELDYLVELGTKQILFACDNFIGTPSWAEAVCDEIYYWQQRTGKRVSLYTWLTVNIVQFPALMRKMRQVGFDMLLIGVESFSTHSLLETAKVQNVKVDIPEAIREIQSYGFIVVAGMIFGFDSDGEDIFKLALDGLEESGLISGDPTFLTALPGTPLYRRIKQSGRLRKVEYGLGAYKQQTNIRYLMPREKLVGGFMDFMKTHNSGAYQYRRLRSLLSCLNEGNFVPAESKGLGNPGEFLRMALRNRMARGLLANRLICLLRSPERVYYLYRGLMLTLRRTTRERRLWRYFQFWVFTWSNLILKYDGLSEDDFDLESVGEEFDISKVLPMEYAAQADEEIPREKIDAQLRLTVAALERLGGKP